MRGLLNSSRLLFYCTLSVISCSYLPRHSPHTCVQLPQASALPQYQTSQARHKAGSPRTSNGNHTVHTTNKSQEPRLLLTLITTYISFRDALRVAMPMIRWVAADFVHVAATRAARRTARLRESAGGAGTRSPDQSIKGWKCPVSKCDSQTQIL